MSGAEDSAVHMSCNVPEVAKAQVPVREKGTRYSSPLISALRQWPEEIDAPWHGAACRDRVRFLLGASYAEKACLFLLNPL